MPPTADVALVSLGTTPGWRRADETFAALIREAGASCELVSVAIGSAGRLRRQTAVTDLVEALAARRSARGIDARAVVYSTVTASLLQSPPAPFAVRFDAPASANRPGVSGVVQRARERRVMSRASVLLPLGEAGAAAVPIVGTPITVVPVPVEPIAGATRRDIDAVTYAGYARKKGLDVVLRAWAQASPAGARLVIAGERAAARRWLERQRVQEPPGVEWAEGLSRERFLELLGRARMFVSASRFEDYGIAQLEALSAGAALVTLPSPGPFEALVLARGVSPELVASDMSVDALTGVLRAALALDARELAAVGERSAAALAPYRPDAVRAVVADRVLPALGVA